MARGTRTVLLTLVGLAVLTAVSVALAYSYRSWQPWMAAHTGSAGGQEPGGAYAYWSGFGSVFPWGMGILATLVVLAYQHVRKMNCHAHGCWKIGTLPVADGGYKVCKKHHREITGSQPTVEHLKAHHHFYLGQHPGKG